MSDFIIIEDNPNVEPAIKRNGGYCINQQISYWDEDGVHPGGKIPPLKCMCRPFRNQKTAGPCSCGRYFKIPKWGLWYPLDNPDVVKTLGWFEKLMLFKDGKYCWESLFAVQQQYIEQGKVYFNFEEVDVKGCYFTIIPSRESRFLEYNTDVTCTWIVPGLLQTIEKYGKTLAQIGGEYIVER